MSFLAMRAKLLLDDFPHLHKNGFRPFASPLRMILSTPFIPVGRRRPFRIQRKNLVAARSQCHLLAEGFFVQWIAEVSWAITHLIRDIYAPCIHHNF